MKFQEIMVNSQVIRGSTKTTGAHDKWNCQTGYNLQWKEVQRENLSTTQKQDEPMTE
jgi:hypothetical protein